MKTSRAVLLIVLLIMAPVGLGILGFHVGGAWGMLIGMVVGSIPVAMVCRRGSRSGHPADDVGDAGFWVSDGSSHSHDSVDSSGWEGGGGDAGGGGADGGGGD